MIAPNILGENLTKLLSLETKDKQPTITYSLEFGWLVQFKNTASTCTCSPEEHRITYIKAAPM